jgi:hypothetical protein
MSGMDIEVLTIQAISDDLTKPGMSNVNIGDEINLKCYDIAMLQLFWLYLREYRYTHSDEWNNSLWYKIPDDEEFDSYRVRVDPAAKIKAIYNANLGEDESTGTAPPTRSNSARTPKYTAEENELLMLKKSLTSLDTSKYKKLKDDKYWETFIRSLRIKLTAHGFQNVMDPNFKPDNEPIKQKLFWLKSTFVYSILDDIIDSDMGKTIV